MNIYNMYIYNIYIIYTYKCIYIYKYIYIYISASNKRRNFEYPH